MDIGSQDYESAGSGGGEEEEMLTVGLGEDETVAEELKVQVVGLDINDRERKCIDFYKLELTEIEEESS